MLKMLISMSQYKVKLIIHISILIFMLCGCRDYASFKNHFLNECGIDVDDQIRFNRLDSLTNRLLEIHAGASYHRYADSLYRSYLYDSTSVKTIKSICRLLSNKGKGRIPSSGRELPLPLIESELRYMYCSVGIKTVKTKKDLIEIVARYARSESPLDEARISKACYKYGCGISDTLDCICLNGIVDGLIRHADSNDANSLTNNEEVLKYAKAGLAAAYSAIDGKLPDPNYTYFLGKCADYAVSVSDADYYTDSLFQYEKKYHLIFPPGREYNGAILKRSIRLMAQSRFSLAQEYLDTLFGSKVSTMIVNPYAPYASYLSDTLSAEEKMQVDNGGHINFMDKRSLSGLSRVMFGPLGIVGNVENARLRYLKGDTTYSQFLNRGFALGVIDSFPLGESDFIDVFLSPSHPFDRRTIDAMTFQYNNSDSRMVYNALLYIKGISNDIYPRLYESIKQSNDNRLIQYVDSIKCYHPFSWKINKHRIEKEKAYRRKLTDFFNRNCISEILSDCLVTFADVREKLKNDESAIEFFKVRPLDPSIEPVYKAAILTKNIEKPIIVTLCKDSEVKSHILEKYGRGSRDRFLFEKIWKPIEPYISTNSTIYYSLDGILNLINLSAIRDQYGNYVGDMYDCYQLSSTKEILQESQLKKKNSIVMFGGLDYNSQNVSPKHNKSLYGRDEGLAYLQGSLNETKQLCTLASHYNINARVLLGEEGTEKEFKRLSGSKLDVLHIATHGFYFSEGEAPIQDYYDVIEEKYNSLSRCGILLSDSGPAWNGQRPKELTDDGILLGSEISRMDLSDIGLIVISACDTALGDITSDGVVGLRAALKLAGVKTMLLAITKIEDNAASVFMRTFYSHLFNGCSAHDAYVSTVREIRNNEEYSDPKYWYPFILIE